MISFIKRPGRLTAAFSTCECSVRGCEFTDRKEEAAAESLPVLRESPAERGYRSAETEGSAEGKARKASWRKKAWAGKEKTAGPGLRREPGPHLPGAWGGVSPGRAALGAARRVCGCPRSQGRPPLLPCFVFPTLWFPNLFGLKSVSNFFFFFCLGVIETKPLNACSFLREIKGDFEQEDHRSQKKGLRGAFQRGGLSCRTPRVVRLAAADCVLQRDRPAWGSRGDTRPCSTRGMRCVRKALRVAPQPRSPPGRRARVESGRGELSRLKPSSPPPRSLRTTLGGRTTERGLGKAPLVPSLCSNVRQTRRSASPTL